MNIWIYSIQKNERLMAPYFLRHYGTFADKIIIYDGGSVDGTVGVYSSSPLAEILGLLSATAKDLGAPLPATEAIQAHFAAAQADGLGEMDSAAVYRRLASMAGLESTGVPAGSKA